MEQKIRLDELARVLDNTGGIHEWIATEQHIESAAVRHGSMAERHQSAERIVKATVFRNLGRGRGSAVFRLRRNTAEEARALASGAAQRAMQGDGPPWSLPPPAAPARVSVADAEIAANPAAAAAAAAESVRREATESLVSAEIRTEKRTVRVLTSHNFASEYTATRVEVDAVFVAGSALDVRRRRARRVREIDPAGLFAEAKQHLDDRALATPLAPGRYDLLVSGSALAGPFLAAGPSRFGWFAPFVAQADAQVVRRGLARYVPGQSIYGTREVSGEHLDLASDGTLAYGLESSPFGPLGEPVRRFDLIVDGVARGLALDMREGALRNQSPNGGVRNLVVGTGREREITLAASTDRVVRVSELSWLETDPGTGGVSGQLAIAHHGGKPVLGGVFSGNLYDIVATAHYAAESVVMGWYRGPKSIFLPGIELR